MPRDVTGRSVFIDGVTPSIPRKRSSGIIGVHLRPVSPRTASTSTSTLTRSPTASCPRWSGHVGGSGTPDPPSPMPGNGERYPIQVDGPFHDVGAADLPARSTSSPASGPIGQDRRPAPNHRHALTPRVHPTGPTPGGPLRGRPGRYRHVTQVDWLRLSCMTSAENPPARRFDRGEAHPC